MRSNRSANYRTSNFTIPWRNSIHIANTDQYRGDRHFLTDFSLNFRTWNSERKENIYFIMLWRGLTSHISVLRYDSIFSFNSKYIKHNINTKYRETLIPSNSTRVILYFGNIRRSCSTCTPVVLFMLVQICHMHEHKYEYTYKKVILYNDKFDIFVWFYLK